ncbi:MAG: TM0106 family RecB-like putative nuclease, partial [Saprospiraceae bacterium]|nr:TM0106 family RecB-like putative nuclease [Saprospiraceae bacterium]
MRCSENRITLSATDLSNHISCRHLTQLNRQACLSLIEYPEPNNPYADLIRKLGLEHEEQYIKHLEASGKRVVRLKGLEGTHQRTQTLAAMQSGAEIITQGKLGNDEISGYADILYRVDIPSNLGDWSYEVGDTKLAQETKAGSVLQLCAYSDLLAKVQGVAPEYFYVIKPGDQFEVERFRFADYAAYYRFMRRELQQAIQDTPGTYPDPVTHCNICIWWPVCDRKRRADDHLSFVAGMHGSHIDELQNRDVHTLEQFALRDKALDSRPRKGSWATYDKLHRQARIQYRGRQKKKRIYELIQATPGEGLTRLPEPSDGDVFFDIESDRFYPEGGLEYLLGIVFREHDTWQYRAWWSFNHREEKRAFEALMDFLTARLEQYPAMHIYHFAPYEKVALQRMMLRHTTRLEEVDWFLRAERFVDL